MGEGIYLWVTYCWKYPARDVCLPPLWDPGEYEGVHGLITPAPPLFPLSSPPSSSSPHKCAFSIRDRAKAVAFFYASFFLLSFMAGIERAMAVRYRRIPAMVFLFFFSLSRRWTPGLPMSTARKEARIGDAPPFFSFSFFFAIFCA